jgi:hypothetical protein
MNAAMSSSSASAIADAVASRRTWPPIPLVALNAAASLTMRSIVNRTLRAWSSRVIPAAVGCTPRRPRISSSTPRSFSSWAIRLLIADASIRSRSAARAIVRHSQTATNRRSVLTSMSGTTRIMPSGASGERGDFRMPAPGNPRNV